MSLELTGDEMLESTERYVASMIAQGFDIVEADDYTLLLDLDGVAGTAAGIARAVKIAQKFHKQIGPVESVEWWQSKSRVGVHVRIVLEQSLTESERIVVQAACGSDPIRELLSMRRSGGGLPMHRVSLLARPKDSKVYRVELSED